VRQAVIQQAAEDFHLPAPALAGVMRRKPAIVSSRSFGVVVGLNSGQLSTDEHVHNLVRKNDKVPLVVSVRYPTFEPNQPSAWLRVMENLDMNKSAALSNSRPIGDVVLQLPPGLPAGTLYDVTFSLNRDGILHVIAFDRRGGRRIEADFKVQGLIEEQELQEARRRATAVTVS
jgi:molecular chaperone DnaK (HSP70)